MDFSNNDWYIRFCAFKEISKLKKIPIETANKIITCLDDKDLMIREDAINFIGRSINKNKNFCFALINCLNHADWNIKIKASSYIGELKEVTEELIYYFLRCLILNFECWMSTFEALKSLVKLVKYFNDMNNKKVIYSILKTLKHTLKHEHYLVRVQSLILLRKLKYHTNDIALIIENISLSDSEQCVRRSAKKTIKKLKNNYELI